LGVAGSNPAGGANGAWLAATVHQASRTHCFRLVSPESRLFLLVIYWICSSSTREETTLCLRPRPAALPFHADLRSNVHIGQIPRGTYGHLRVEVHGETSLIEVHRQVHPRLPAVR